MYSESGCADLMAAIITDPMYYSSLIRQKAGDEKYKKRTLFIFESVFLCLFFVLKIEC